MFDQQFGPPFLSHFSTAGRLQSTIDFAFQLAARGFASQSGPTDALRTFFADDDYYTDVDSNAYAMPTFLGNHDMGRVGHFLQRVDQPDAADAELLARSKLAHALMFFARGQPVIYYGDEQGFTGDGGDKDAREDMFANAVPVYEDNDLIGTDQTTSDDNFDPSHPLYRAIRDYSKLYERHAALRTGAQIHRYSADGPGRVRLLPDRPRRARRVRGRAQQQRDRRHRRGADVLARPERATSSCRVHPILARACRRSSRPAPDGVLSVTVPPLGFVIYQAGAPVAASDEAPGISITSLQHGDTAMLETNSWDGHDVLDRIEVAAELDADVLAEVTFAVRVGDGEYVPIGTDDNAPYRVSTTPATCRASRRRRCRSGRS